MPAAFNDISVIEIAEEPELLRFLAKTASATDENHFSFDTSDGLFFVYPRRQMNRPLGVYFLRLIDAGYTESRHILPGQVDRPPFVFSLFGPSSDNVKFFRYGDYWHFVDHDGAVPHWVMPRLLFIARGSGPPSLATLAARRLLLDRMPGIVANVMSGPEEDAQAIQTALPSAPDPVLDAIAAVLFHVRAWTTAFIPDTDYFFNGPVHASIGDLGEPYDPDRHDPLPDDFQGQRKRPRLDLA